MRFICYNLANVPAEDLDFTLNISKNIFRIAKSLAQFNYILNLIILIIEKGNPFFFHLFSVFLNFILFILYKD